MHPLLLLTKLLVLALLGATPLRTTQGFATEFGYRGDSLAGGDPACLHRAMRVTDFICAHRSLPCGTPLLLVLPRTGRVAVCQVGDRGPYGAVLPDGQLVLKLSAKEEGRWRGLVDLSPPVAAMLGLSGRERVFVFLATPPPPVARHSARQL